MELSDIILAFVSVLSAITGGIVKTIMKDIKDLEHNMTSCQIGLHKDFIHRDEFLHTTEKIEKLLDSQTKKIDQNWKHMRVDHGKN